MSYWPSPPRCDGRLSIGHDLSLVAHSLQHATGDLLVDQVVFGEQHALAALWLCGLQCLARHESALFLAPHLGLFAEHQREALHEVTQRYGLEQITSEADLCEVLAATAQPG